jgi:hypothetical protein
MGISIDPVVGRGIVFDHNDQYKDDVLSFVKYLKPSINEYDDDILEIVMYEMRILDKDLTFEYVGNLVTGNGARTFIKILTEKGEDILKGFSKPIVQVNDVCIM